MNKYLLLLPVLLAAINCWADPDWEIVVYTNSTVAYSRVTIDEIPASEGDILAAFVEGECRGLADIFISDGESYGTMNIQGDVPEQVSFLVWDQSIDTICSVEYTTVTQPGYDIGYPPDFLPIAAYSGNPINHYPELNLPESFVIPEDVPTSWDFNEFCFDIDGDPLTVSGIDSEHISVSVNAMIVTLASAQDWVGIEYVTFWLSDGSLSVHDSVQVFVTAVNDPPVITDTYPATGALEVSQYQQISFAVTAHDIDSAITYAWFIDNQIQPAEDYIFGYLFDELGNFEVSCLVSDGEYDVSAHWQVSVVPGSYDENNISEFLSISPNPCSNQLTIAWSQSRFKDADISLYNLRGRKVMQFLQQSSGNITTSRIADLPSGIYFIRLSSGNSRITRKITIR
jgi:hypothetical protein